MACGWCQKRAKERAAQLKKQAELMKKQSENKVATSSKKALIPENVNFSDANTAYFEAKQKLFWNTL